MLSRLSKASLLASRSSVFVNTPIRSFRPGKMGMLNPYRHDPTPLSEEEK